MPFRGTQCGSIRCDYNDPKHPSSYELPCGSHSKFVGMRTLWVDAVLASVAWMELNTVYLYCCQKQCGMLQTKQNRYLRMRYSDRTKVWHTGRYVNQLRMWIDWIVKLCGNACVYRNDHTQT